MVTKTIIAIIRNNQTGEVRECPTFCWAIDPDYTRYEGVLFYWLDGDGSCDCKRSIFFHRSGDEEEHPSTCGDERYSLLALREEGYELVFWSLLDNE
jgi:hypothetical protein